MSQPFFSGFHDRADWTRVTAVYRQMLTCSENEDGYVPEILPAFLAELLSRVSTNYDASDPDFIADASYALTSVEEGVGPADLYQDSRFLAHRSYVSTADGKRRRPPPFEAVIETIRRLRDLDQVEGLLRDRSVTAVLGGSMSYGRFFNVMGASTSSGSDLDLLLVTSGNDETARCLETLRDLPGVDATSLDAGLTRLDAFRSHQSAGDLQAHTVFSHKVNIWNNLDDPILDEINVAGDYNISLHVFDTQAFGNLLLSSSPAIKFDGITSPDRVQDFRETDPGRQDHQRSFSGSDLHLTINSEALGDSFIRESHLFHMSDDDRYYPGMFQNLVLPAFDVRWGSKTYTKMLTAFRWKMVERLRYERRLRPDEMLRLSFSHTRSHVFAPHLVRSVDSSTALS